MRYRSTIALFLLSLVLAGFYFLYLRPKAEERGRMEDFERQFFRADPREIEFVRIETGEGSVDVVRTGNEWLIEKPKQYQPDQQALSKMFDALSQGRLIKIVGAAGDRKTFGLDRPYIIVSLGFSGKTDVLEIGDKSPTAKGFYAYNRRFGKVFLVNEEFVRDFNLNLYDLRDKQLFHVNPWDIARIRIRRDKETVDLEKTRDAWRMGSPVSAKVSPEDIERLVQAVSVQRAAGFVDWTTELARLPRRISLELFDAGQNLLDSAVVSYWGTGGDQGALVHRDRATEAARTSRDFFTLLDNDSSVYRFRNLFNARGNILKITVAADGKREVIENNGGWKKEGVRVPESKVQELIDLLRNMKAVKVLQENRSLGKPTVTIEVRGDGGESRLTVTNFSMDHEIAPTMALFVPVKPGHPGGRKKVDYWYALSRDLGAGVVVSSLDIQNILDRVADLSRE